METFSQIVGLARYVAPLFALVGGFYFVNRFVRAHERRAENKAEMAELRARIAQLEEAQEIAERDILRLQAAQEFSTQLLGTRLAGVVPPAGYQGDR